MSNNRWPTPARFPALPAGSDISSTVSSAQPFLQNPPQPARHPQPQPHPPTSSNVQYRTPSRLHSQNAPQVNRSTETGKVPVLRPTGVRPYMNPSQAHSPQKRHQNPVNAGIVPHQPAYPARSPPAQSSAAQQPQTGIIPYQSHMPVPYMPPLSGFPGGVVPMPPSFPSNPMYPAPYPYPYPAQPYYDPAFQPPYPSQPETPAAKVQRDFRTAIDSLPGMPYTRGKMAPAITARWVTDGTNFQLIPPSRMIHIPSEEDENPFPELKQPPPEILPRSTSSYVLQPGQTHYETLGVDPSWPEDTIFAIAEARLARMQMRIDDPKSDPDLRAAARMIYNNLVDAYEVLRDSNSRLKYDLSIGLVQEWPPAEEADCPPEQNPPNTSCNNPALPNTPANKSKEYCWPEKNPYEVLDVACDATITEIEDAYQKFHQSFLETRLTLDEHRLRYAQAALAEKKKAFKFLMNPKHRRRYDKFLVYGTAMSDSSDEEESMPHEQDKPNCPSVPDTRQSDLAGFNGSSDAFTRNAPLSKGDAGDDTRTKTSQATVACQGRIPGPSHRYEDCEMDYGSTRPVDTISDMNVLEHEQSNIPARPDQLKFGKVDPALQAGHETRDLGRATHHVGRNGSNIPLRRSQRSSVRDTRRE